MIEDKDGTTTDTPPLSGLRFGAYASFPITEELILFPHGQNTGMSDELSLDILFKTSEITINREEREYNIIFCKTHNFNLPPLA